MRFRKTSTPPPFLNSRHQRRLLLLVGLLVLVLVLIRLAAKPSTWNWLFVGRGTSKTAAQQEQRKTRTEPRPLKADEFRAEAKPPAAKPAAPAGGVALTANAKGGDSVDLTLDPALFAKVEDRTLNLRFGELEGYYRVLARVAAVPQQALRDLAQRNGPVPFSVLRNEPKSYRGRAIGIEGRLGSLRVLENSRPDLGLKTLYEAWIVTPESGTDPYRVVFSELPAGLEPQDRYSDPPHVRATGYFFKVQTYEVKPGDDQSHTAPLLLAKRIQRIDLSGAPPPPALGLAKYVVGFALLLGGILAVFMWRFTRGDRQFAEQQLQRYDPARNADPAELKHLETTDDPQEFFRRLSETETAAEPHGDAR